MKKLFFVWLLSLAYGLPFSVLYAQQKTFVIVHGAWGGGWSFKKIDTLLWKPFVMPVDKPAMVPAGEIGGVSNQMKVF